MKIVVIALLTCAAISGQSRDNLIRKYGKPISETFMVRPEIGVTVTYTASGVISELLVSPQTKAMIKSRGTTISQDTVRAILEELLPSSKRGKLLTSEFENLTCLPENDCQGSSENYQKLSIYYKAGAEGGVTYAVVRWKQ